MANLDHAHTVADEINALDTPIVGPEASFLALSWGLMRALAKCEDCGEMRIPQDKEWSVLWCPGCKGVWRKRTEEGV